MEAYVPIFQSILWIGLILLLIRMFTPEIQLIRNILNKRLKEGGAVEIGPIKLGELKKEQAHLAKEIALIKLVATLIVSDYERMHLQNLVSEEPFVAEVKPGSTFEWELRHLLTLKLVDRHPGKGMRTLLDQEKGNIKAHLFITELGRKYLKVLEEVNI